MSRALTHAQQLALQETRRLEDEQRLKKLYGPLLPDVEFLRKRGFVIVKEAGRLELDNRTVTAEELQAVAARERRLAEPSVDPVRQVAMTTSGQKIGDRVSLKAKRSAAGQVPLAVAKEKLAGAALASKTKAEQASTDLGPVPRLDWLPLDQLGVDRRYQREMGKDNWAHVNRILREWSWQHYQPIVVAPGDGGAEGWGRYVVVDGQHRLEAARKHPSIDRLPCYIVDAPDLAQQARAFVALNARRIGVTRLQRFWASHAAGDATARRIHRICDEAGVTITKSGGALPPRTTFATFTLEKLLTVGGGHITAALKIIGETHGDKPDVFKSALIFAVTQVVAAPSFDRPRFTRVMKALDLEAALTAARSWRAQNRGSLELALTRHLNGLYAPATLKEVA